jgi:hypothetical protein
MPVGSVIYASQRAATERSQPSCSTHSSCRSQYATCAALARTASGELSDEQALGYSCIQAGTSTLFVALAEDPQALAAKDPALFAEVQRTVRYPLRAGGSSERSLAQYPHVLQHV